MSRSATVRRARWLPGTVAAAMVAVLAGVGAAVRDPWHDELFTWRVATLSWGAIVDALRLDSGPPGHYLLSRLLVAAGVDSVSGLRALSVVAVAVGAWLVVAVAGRRGLRPAWAAAILVAFHPLLLAAGAEARAYSMLLALAAGAVWLVDGSLTRRRAAALAVVLAAACWVHSLGLVLAGAVAVVAVTLASPERARAWAAVLAALASHLPWLPVMVRQPPESLMWMDGALALAPLWKRPLLPLIQVSPAARSAPWIDLTQLPAALELLAVPLWLALVANGVRHSRRARRLSLLWAVAAAVLVAVTFWARPVYVPGRAESLLVPAALVVASLAVVKRRWQWLAVAVLGACGLATSLMSLVSWATAKPGPEARVARVLATGAGAGDVVVTTGWWLLGVQHALGADGAGLKWLTFPGESARHPGWYDDGWALPLAADEAPTFARRVEPTRDQGRRVWLVRTPALISDRLLDGVVHDLDLVPVAVEGELWSVWASPPESPGRGRQQ